MTDDTTRPLPSKDVLAASLAYYRERLAESELLDRRVELPNAGGAFTVAVPVGTLRRGGHTQYDPILSARQVVEMLDRPADFPNLRFEKADGWSPMLMWGAPEPDLDDFEDPVAYELARGEYYGYTKQSTAEHLARVAAYLEQGLDDGEFDEDDDEVKRVRPVYETDAIFLALLADLQKWGAIERWGVDEANQCMVVVRWDEEWTLHDADEVETYVSGLIDGWLLARSKSCEPHQLHQEERDQIGRRSLPEDHPDYPKPREPHNEDQAAIDYLERPAPAGEDDPDWGGEGEDE